MCTVFKKLGHGGSKSAEKLSQTLLPMTLKSCTLGKSIILTLKELTDERGKQRDERQKKETEAL